MKSKLFISAILFFYLSFSYADESSKSLRIVYPDYGDQKGIDYNYVKNLIYLAISKSGESALIEPSNFVFSSDFSAFESLIDQKYITIFWGGANKDLELSARAIYFPIFKGIFSYRLIVSNKDVNSQISNAKDLRDLSDYVVGQGYGWSEVDIFKDNGFSVVQADKESIYMFTSTGDVELFPRSIFGAMVSEKNIINKYNNLAVCKKVILYYPHYMYFYVNKDNTLLYNALENGLKKSYNDGSFNELFSQVIQDTGILKILKNPNIITIKLDNNHLSEKSNAIPIEMIFKEE